MYIACRSISNGNLIFLQLQILLKLLDSYNLNSYCQGWIDCQLRALTDCLKLWLTVLNSDWLLRNLTDQFKFWLTDWNSDWPTQILTDQLKFWLSTVCPYHPNSYCLISILTTPCSYQNCTFGKNYLYRFLVFWPQMLILTALPFWQ